MPDEPCDSSADCPEGMACKGIEARADTPADCDPYVDDASTIYVMRPDLTADRSPRPVGPPSIA